MCFHRTAAVIAAAAVLSLANAQTRSASGDYTQAQAQSGKQVYANNCAMCHGSGLKGQSGPPLAGKAFGSNLQFSHMSAKQLFEFTKQHMPKNAPGSLTDEQYREVFAYILSQNGYPAGQQKLTADSIGKVNLLPYPGNQNGTSGQAK